MTPRLTTNCAKNYCNRTLIVKVILENVVTCFLLGHSVLTSPHKIATSKDYVTILHAKNLTFFHLCHLDFSLKLVDFSSVSVNQEYIYF